MCLTGAHQVSFSELLRNTRGRVCVRTGANDPTDNGKPFSPSPDNYNGRIPHRNWSGSRVAFFEVTVWGAQELSLGDANGAKDAFRELGMDPPIFAPLEVPRPANAFALSDAAFWVSPFALL
jgi:hypothetical protein